MLKMKTLALKYNLLTSGLNVLVTVIVCSWMYSALVWTIGQAVVPTKAEGSLIYNSSGVIIGSHLIAQKFTEPGYFWSRPSAVDYNASGSGGSNLSATNPVLRQRIQKAVAILDSNSCKLIPADLIMASGSGLDPDISVQSAMFQAERVAKARGTSIQEINKLIINNTSASIPLFGRQSLVNVLNLNLALDKTTPIRER